MKSPTIDADPGNDDLELFTIREVAAKLRVHSDTVRARIADGSLGHVRAGRFVRISPAQLRQFIDGNSHDAD